ncbi:uric acid degradation bifunctional protein TTL isoform X4 [Cryptomeria japonica]|uniref:uric acid degradation bifunctional protein TTL isoform X4 n=1 Tax=Cryptomeria japonica TaxID=3369 RepID=UPI0027DA2A74|nr:uric acid degradation bifunctional protein TTL isoform X4 [Cryptomeria japonica]
MDPSFSEEDFKACCGSTKFASEMAKGCPFSSLSQAVDLSREIWFNKVDVPGYLEAFAAHPQIGDVKSLNNKSASSTEWCKGEQSAALSTATDSTLKNRFGNRPIVELEIAVGEQQKIIELRLAKLFTEKGRVSQIVTAANEAAPVESTDRRLSQIGGHLISSAGGLENVPLHSSSRSRPPITTHVLDVSRGKPGAGIKVLLESWKGSSAVPDTLPGLRDATGWALLGSSTTDDDGRCGSLMPVLDHVPAGIYRISFNTGEYYMKMGADIPGNETKGGFYPYVSIVFEIKSFQTLEHFHVPVLLSPFSFTTYRGS